MRLVGFGLGLALLIVILVVAILVFEVWMFIAAVRNSRLNDTEKILWCVGMLLIHPFVAIAYYFVEYAKA